LVGANIITTAGSEAKLAQAKALGAHYGINYRQQDFLHEVRRITGKRGVDVVVEHIGAEVWERSLLCLTTGGRLVTCGATSGYQAKTDLRHVFFRHLRILGATTASKGVLWKLMRLVAEGRIAPVLDRVLPLREARRAHEVVEAREQFGKIVLIPDVA
jgi:NADPH:quinone reductase-like Zn-dependent oxidoreductase